MAATAVLVQTVSGSGRDVATGMRYDRVRATVRRTEFSDGD
jgi:hypothetical protein